MTLCTCHLLGSGDRYTSYSDVGIVLRIQVFDMFRLVPDTDVPQLTLLGLPCVVSRYVAFAGVVGFGIGNPDSRNVLCDAYVAGCGERQFVA